MRIQSPRGLREGALQGAQGQPRALHREVTLHLLSVQPDAGTLNPRKIDLKAYSVRFIFIRTCIAHFILTSSNFEIELKKIQLHFIVQRDRIIQERKSGYTFWFILFLMCVCVCVFFFNISLFIVCKVRSCMRCQVFSIVFVYDIFLFCFISFSNCASIGLLAY